MHLQKLAWILVLVAALANPLPAEEPATGSVRLPLPDYLTLLEKVEDLEHRAREETEEPTADLAAETTSVVLRGEVAEMATTFEVELAGTPTLPVALPFSGMAEEVAVEPRRGAGLHREDGRVVLFAPRPGSYRVTVRGRQVLRRNGGGLRLELAASDAPVSSVEIELPAEQEWSCEGAVLVEETTRDRKTLVRLAPERGRSHVFEIRRRNAGQEEERTLVSSSLVTVVEVRPGGTLARQDVVLYEVLRGELGTFELELPAGQELERIATDEGEAFPVLDGRRLTVEREHRLAGTGHLVVTYRPQRPDGRALGLAPLVPRFAPRARFLVAASAVAADLRPQPSESWRRADLADLPEGLRSQIAALRPNAVWSLTSTDRPTSLLASLLPEAPRVGGVVWERETMTLLSVDGALVHRDRLLVEGMGTAFEVEMEPGSTLWSARVDNLAVRPLERGTAVVVPLAFKTEGKTRIELVTVEGRKVERGRSSFRVLAPRIREPVLRHAWRLLLPESHRYRVASSELGRVDGAAQQAYRNALLQVAAKKERIPFDATRDESGLGAEILGRVVDGDGAVIPGATATLLEAGRIEITDAAGRFSFRGLRAHRYQLRVELDGFYPFESLVTAAASQTTDLEITLSPAVVAEEMIVVSSEASLLDARQAAKARREMEERERAAAFDDALDDFESGWVGGVKPLAVAIPESGKLLLLSGALPPARVGVELDVRARR